MHPGVRENTDLAVVFQQTALNQRKAIAEQYCGNSFIVSLYILNIVGELEPESVYQLIDKYCKIDPSTGARWFIAFDVRNW